MEVRQLIPFWACIVSCNVFVASGQTVIAFLWLAFSIFIYWQNRTNRSGKGETK